MEAEESEREARRRERKRETQDKQHVRDAEPGASSDTNTYNTLTPHTLHNTPHCSDGPSAAPFLTTTAD
jgi:hypothetical protein